MALRRPNNPAAARVARGSLFVAGLGVMLEGFAQPDGQSPLAAWALGLGALMAILATLVPWIARAEVSPTSGLSVAMRDPQADVAAELAEEVAADEEDGPGGGPEVEADELIGVSRLQTASIAIAGVLATNFTCDLSDCEWHLFLYDNERERLLPVFEPDDGAESEGWRVGQGATGAAWERGEFVLVLGAETNDETYGLSPEQQARYRDLQAVAAMPVRSWSGATIAVLTAATRNTDSDLARRDGAEEVAWKAFHIGRVLIDLLHWFDD